MGTPLGPTMANYYMCNLENSVFNDQPILKPPVYCRYIDDIFVSITDFQQLLAIKEAFEDQSILNFTYEIECKKKIPFLDTLIHRNSENLLSTVYGKPTSNGECLNYESICPEKYKTSVIKDFLHRSFKICSTQLEFRNDINRIKQILINNNFPNKLVDKHIKQFINKNLTTHHNNRINQDNSSETGVNSLQSQPEANTTNNEKRKHVNIYYRNQMTNRHQMEENELQQIFKKHIKPTSIDTTPKLIIYYKNKKLRNLFIRNSPHKTPSTHNVVYEYVCDQAPCDSVHTCYVGYTASTIKDRFKQHASIKKHFQKIHSRNITGSQMLPNVSVIHRANNKRDLQILEALTIKYHSPIINSQVEDFNRTLKIFK